MRDFLVRVAINAVAIIVVLKLVPRVRFDDGGEWWKLLLVAAALAVINALLRPITRIVALPLNLLTLGLAGLLINAGLLLLLALVVDRALGMSFTIAGWPDGPFRVETLVYGVLAALVISIVSAVLGLTRRLVPGI
jgi:putative membrane protein